MILLSQFAQTVPENQVGQGFQCAAVATNPNPYEGLKLALITRAIPRHQLQLILIPMRD